MMLAMNVQGQPVYARETFEAAYDEAEPLLALHYREIAHYQDIPLDVNEEAYRTLETLDMLRVFTVRLAADAETFPLIGYAVFVVNRNPHYKGSLQAVQDIIYVDPEFRKGRVGLNLLRFCEDELRAEGVQVILHHVKEKHPTLGFVLAKMGYEHIDSIYARRLDL